MCLTVIRKILQAENRDLRAQTIQAINNSEARHQAFASWVYSNLGKRGAGNRYISAGIISEHIAENVAELSQGEKISQRLLVMSERSLAHANSPKHHAGNIGLSAGEYASISRIIASESLVVLDKTEGHHNLIYFTADRKIKVVVTTALNTKRLKPRESVDAVINAYKVEDYGSVLSAIKGGQYIVIKGKP
ncbi:hypothetical protein [Aggregatibacter actinomycetemcomitans]|uniref:hypothetical protein n=1 Tax=Aggregatibacter actinomycetemcomitans TaxID=714 RepID=UPI001E4162F8|nr:hypothetical protein [Aggregatibacter actinomycetemcomitans]